MVHQEKTWWIEFFKNLTNDKLNQSYKNNLERLGQTDTLIAVAE